MKKLLLTFCLIFMINFVFADNYIGYTKKHFLESVKDVALKIEKPEKSSGGYYSITVTFPNSSGIYSFTKDDYCYFYILMERYIPSNYMYYTNYFDERYKRAFDDPCSKNEKKTDVWLDSKGDTYVYRWIILNLNKSIQYTVYTFKEDYESNKFLYLEKLLK